MNAAKAKMSKGCNKLVPQDGTKRSCSPFFCAKDSTFFGKWGHAQSKSKIGFTAGSQGCKAFCNSVRIVTKVSAVTHEAVAIWMGAMP